MGARHKDTTARDMARRLRQTGQKHTNMHDLLRIEDRIMFNNFKPDWSSPDQKVYKAC